jgi:hypothetical protein
MYKLHVAHRESGYITRVEYKETTDPEGASDWKMLYTPSPKAFAEYEAFTHRHSQRPVSTPPASPIIGYKQQQPLQTQLGFYESEFALLTELTARGIAEKKARGLLSAIKPGQEVMDQLKYVDSLVAKDKGRSLENPPGLYVCYVRDNITPPAIPHPHARRSYMSRSSSQRSRSRTEGSARNRIRRISRPRGRALHHRGPARRRVPADVRTTRAWNRAAFRSMTQRQLDDIAEAAIRADLQNTAA